MSLLKMEINLNKKFHLEHFIETVVLSNINSQRNFAFIYHNIICETPSSYYIFLPLECNSICETTPLTTFSLPQIQR